MLRASFHRLVPYAAILLPAVIACTTAVHDVGSDTNDAGTTSDSGKTGCTGTPPEYNGPDVPVGCTLPVVCDDGAWKLGSVTCPDDAGVVDAGHTGCTGTPPEYNGPDVPVGCTLPVVCDDGQWKAEAVTCPPDGGTSTGDAGCTGSPPSFNGPAIPVGCTEPVTCVDGSWKVGPIVCPDAGSGGDAASKFFECGKAFCNSASEYCEVTPDCIGPADGGPPPGGNSVCKPLPTQCGDNANSCKCISEEVNGISIPGSFTDTDGCSVTFVCA